MLYIRLCYLNCKLIHFTWCIFNIIYIYIACFLNDIYIIFYMMFFIYTYVLLTVFILIYLISNIDFVYDVFYIYICIIDRIYFNLSNIDFE